MSVSTDLQQTQDRNQTTPSGDGQVTNQQAPVSGGGAKKLRRGTGYAAGQAALTPAKPGGGAKPDAGPKAETRAMLDGPNADERKKLLKASDKTIDKIEGLLSYGAFDWNVTAKEAKQAAGMLEGAGDQARIVMLQELNRRDKAYVGRMMDNLDAAARRAFPRTTLTHLGLTRDQGAITKLLTDEPAAAGVTAQIAPVAFLMRTVSAGQLTGYARQGGKTAAHVKAWLKLTDKPVGPPLLASFTAAEGEAAQQRQEKEEAQKKRAADEKALADKTDKAMKEDKTFASQVKSIEDLLSYGAIDWAITDKEARKVFSLLAGIGDAERVRMVVYKLDQGGYMDRFISNLSEGDRWKDKKTFLRILSARAPEKNVAYVKELMSRGVFDWAVTDEEARLAFQLVKTMPKDIRQQFKDADGGKWWDRMEGNLSVEDTSDRDANLYANTEQSQKLKLSFQEDCAKLSQGQLKMQMEMLFRMGEVDFVESALIAAGLDKSAEHAWIYATYGLKSSSAPRNDKIWSKWMDNSVAKPKESNGWAAAGAALSTLGDAAGEALGLGDGNVHVDLQKLAGVGGGTVAGATVAERKEGDEETNTADLDVSGWDDGRVALTVPVLALSSVNRLSGGVQLQTGAITAKGVRIEAKWATEKDPSAFFSVDVAGLDVADLWQVTEDQMVGAGHLSLTALRIQAKTPKAAKPKGKAESLGLLMQEVQDTLTLMLRSVQIEEPKPEAVSAALGKSFGAKAEAQVSLGGLTVTDFATSKGDYASKVAVKDVKLDLKRTLRTDALRKEIAELEKVAEPTGEQTAKLEAARKQLDALASKEARYKELSAKYDGKPESLEGWEREELLQLRDALSVSEATVEVGAVSVQNADVGGTKVDSLEVKGLQGSMRTQKAGADGKTARLGYDLGASFQVASVDVKGLDKPGQSKLEAYDARIAELKSKLDAKRGTDADAAEYARLSEQSRAIHKKIVRRDGLKLREDRLGPEEQELLAKLNQELAGWEAKGAGLKVDAMHLKGVQGGVDSKGAASVKVAEATVEGVEQDGLKVGKVQAKGVELGVGLKGGLGDAQKAMTDGGGKGLLGQVASLDLKAKELGVADVEMKGKRPSDTLQAELDALKLKAELHPADMTAKDKERLAELPTKIGEAKKNEARLAELRALQKADPKAFTPEMADELRQLQKYDATVKRVASVQAADVAVGFDKDKGTLSASVGSGKDGAPAGLDVKGVQVGRVVDGQEVTDLKVDEASAQSLGVTADVGKGDVLDVTRLTKGKADVKAKLSARGLHVKGFEQGQKGQGTYRKLDEGSVAKLDVGYDSSKYVDRAPGQAPVERQGKVTLDMDGASLKGLTMEHASKLQEVVAWIRRLEAKDTLTPGEQKTLATLKAQRQQYDALQAQLKAAKSKKARARIQRKIAAWSKHAETSVTEAHVSDTQVSLGGVGSVKDMTSPGYDPKTRDLAVSAHVGEVGVSGVKAQGAKVKSASVHNLNVQGSNLLDADKRYLHATMDKATVKGASGKGAWVSKATVKKADVTLNGSDASAKARYIGVAGAGKGGDSVGYAGLSGAQVNVHGLGTGKMSASGSFASVSASRLKHRDKGMTATVNKLKGRKGSFSLSPGGKVTAGLKQFSGDGVEVVTTNKDGSKSTYGVGDFKGEGVSLSKDKGGMHAGLGSFEANEVTADNAGGTGRTAEIGKVKINGVAVDTKSDGSVDAKVQSAGMSGVTWDDGAGHKSTVGEVSATDMHALVNPKTKTVASAGVGHFQVADAHVREGDNKVDVDLVTVDGVKATGVDYSNTKDVKGAVDVKAIHATKLDATLAGKDGAGPTTAHLDSGDIKGIHGEAKGGGKYEGSVADVDLRGLKGDATLSDGTKVGGGADRLHLQGLQGKADTKEGSYEGGFKKVDVKGIHGGMHKANGDYVTADGLDVSVGDGKSVSSVLYKDGKLDGSIKAIHLGSNKPQGSGPNLKFRMTDAKSGKVNEGKAALANGFGKQNTKAGNIDVDEVRFTNFNPKEIHEAGSTVQVFGVGADHFVYNDKHNTVYGDGVKLQAAFLQGQGGGEVQAGFKGASVDNLQAWNDGGKDGSRENYVGVKDLKSSGGYANLAGMDGKDFKLVHAQLKDASVGKVNVRYKVHTKKYGSYQEALEAWKKADAEHKAAPPFDPAKDQLVLDGLGNTDGRVKASYEYYKKTGSVGNTIAGWFIGHEAGASGRIKDGELDVGGLDLTSDGLLSGAFVNTLQLGVNAGGGIGRMVRGKKNGVVGVTDLNGMKMGGGDGPARPTPTNYNQHTDLSKLHRVKADVQLSDMGGGKIQAGRNFQGNMVRGGSAWLKTKDAGSYLEAATDNIGFTDVQAGDGKAKMDYVGFDHLGVQVWDAASGEPVIAGNLQNGKLTGVQTGQISSQKKKASDANYDALTTQ